jgi:hypothetical protein
MGSNNLISYAECCSSSSVLQVSLKWDCRQLTPLLKHDIISNTQPIITTQENATNTPALLP